MTVSVPVPVTFTLKMQGQLADCEAGVHVRAKLPDGISTSPSLFSNTALSAAVTTSPLPPKSCANCGSQSNSNAPLSTPPPRPHRTPLRPVSPVWFVTAYSNVLASIATDP